MPVCSKEEDFMRVVFSGRIAILKAPEWKRAATSAALRRIATKLVRNHPAKGF